MVSDDIAKQLKPFLDENGKLRQYPKKRKPKMLSLYYLASKFEPQIEYSEEEINRIIEAWHTFNDWAMLRRDLYDNHFFDRKENGSIYWPKDPPPRLEDILPQ